MSDPFAELVTELLGATSMLSASVSSESASTPGDALSKSRCLTATETLCEEDASTVTEPQQLELHSGSQSEDGASTDTAGSDSDSSPNTASSRTSVHGFTSALDARLEKEVSSTPTALESSLEADLKPASTQATAILSFPSNPHAMFRADDEIPRLMNMIRRRNKVSQTVEKQVSKSLDLRAAAPIFTPTAKPSQTDQKLNVKAATFQPKGSEKPKESPKSAFVKSSPQRGTLATATSKSGDALEIAKQNRRETGIPEPQELVPVHISSAIAIENRCNSHRFESWNVPVEHPIFQVSPSAPLSAMCTWATYANEQAQLEHGQHYSDHSGWIDQRRINLSQAFAVFPRHKAVAPLCGVDETSQYADILKKTGFASIEEAKKILTSWAIISNYVHELAKDAAAKNPSKNDLGTVNAKFCLMRQLQEMVGLPD